jgi:hypothetical protein
VLSSEGFYNFHWVSADPSAYEGAPSLNTDAIATQAMLMLKEHALTIARDELWLVREQAPMLYSRSRALYGHPGSPA